MVIGLSCLVAMRLEKVCWLVGRNSGTNCVLRVRMRARARVRDCACACECGQRSNRGADLHTSCMILATWTCAVDASGPPMSLMKSRAVRVFCSYHHHSFLSLCLLHMHLSDRQELNSFG